MVNACRGEQGTLSTTRNRKVAAGICAPCPMTLWHPSGQRAAFLSAHLLHMMSWEESESLDGDSSKVQVGEGGQEEGRLTEAGSRLEQGRTEMEMATEGGPHAGPVVLRTWGGGSLDSWGCTSQGSG